MRVLFAGTPEFAAVHLAGLLESRHSVAGVLTQPDRPAGRGRKLKAGPVKALALEHGLAVDQPASLKPAAAQQAIRDLAPDLMVVVAYGLLLPAAVLDIPARGCINVHASLLPRWRGAAPIQRAILAGDAESGVSIMQMDPGLDTGPVYLESRCPIHDTDTAADLHDRLAELGREALVRALDLIESGAARATPQDDTGATYAPKITKAEAVIDWARPAAEIHRQVRAFNPWPVAHTALDGSLLRVWECRPRAAAPGTTPGTIVGACPAGLTVATGAGWLDITRLQLAGGRPMTARDYLNAHPDPRGLRLGAAAP